MENKELYYAIMNIADYLALHGYTSKSDCPTLYKMLKDLSAMGFISISDIADANDLGECKTWTDVVIALKANFEKGERV